MSFIPLRYSLKAMNETQDFMTAIVMSKYTIQTKMLTCLVKKISYLEVEGTHLRVISSQ